MVDRYTAIVEQSAVAPQRDSFIWTDVAKEIQAVARTAVLLKTIGVCHGDAGIGKTWTLRALLDEFPGSFLVTITDSTRTVRQLLLEITKEVGVIRDGRCRTLRESLIQTIQGSYRLCMVDEAHMASTELLNTIRQLHDECEIPVLLVGMSRLVRNLMRSRGDDSMGATIYSRVGIIRDLEERLRKRNKRQPLYGTDDIRRVFATSKLAIAPDALRWLREMANFPQDGGLRAARNALRLAEHIATQSKEPVETVTAHMLQHASRLLQGTHRANTIARHMQQKKDALT